MPASDILFVHNNFPGQFGFLVPHLVKRGHRLAAIGSPTASALPGVSIVHWQNSRSTSAGILPEAVRAEADLIRARAAAEAALKLRSSGFSPAVIIGHAGWGETIYMREIFPDARLVIYAEYFYRTHDGDVGFDPEFGPLYADVPYTLHAKNMGLALGYADADRIVAPTPFQASRLPVALQAQTRVIHEGVNTSRTARVPKPRVKLADGRVLDGATPVVTFVSRRLEPLRGCHIFMRALPAFLAAVPEAEVLIIGADEKGGYGQAAEGPLTWGQQFFNEVRDRLDVSRVHFMGRVPYDTMLAALSLSSAHVYYTYPFVLSWSLLEALACGCLVIGSDTAPVRDAIRSGENGILLDFFDVDALAHQMTEACRTPERFTAMRAAARQSVLDDFDRERITAPAWLKLLDEMGARPGRSV